MLERQKFIRAKRDHNDKLVVSRKVQLNEIVSIINIYKASQTMN